MLDQTGGQCLGGAPLLYCVRAIPSTKNRLIAFYLLLLRCVTKSFLYFVTTVRRNVHCCGYYIFQPSRLILHDFRPIKDHATNRAGQRPAAGRGVLGFAPETCTELAVRRTCCVGLLQEANHSKRWLPLCQLRWIDLHWNDLYWVKRPTPGGFSVPYRSYREITGRSILISGWCGEEYPIIRIFWVGWHTGSLSGLSRDQAQ